MNIAYVLPSPDLGGGNKVIFQHAELLAERGHRVSILGEGPPPEWTGLAIPYFDHSQGTPDLPPQDLVISTFWTTIERARSLALGPIAHFCQGYEGGHLHYQRHLEAIESAYGHPHPNLTVTPYLTELLESQFGNPGKVVPPPLDRRFRRRRWRRGPAEPPWIAIPGVFGARVKGVETAWRAVEILRGRGLDCRVVRISTIPMCDDERGRYQPDRFLGAVRPEVIASELPSLDLLLMPSEPEEGFGLPLLEAMASGVPAVASRIPSTVFMAGDATTLVPVGDAEAFADAAEGLLGDRRRWRRARRNGLQAAERFAPERVADMLEQAISWAATAARNGSGPAPTSQHIS